MQTYKKFVLGTVLKLMEKLTRKHQQWSFSFKILQAVDLQRCEKWTPLYALLSEFCIVYQNSFYKMYLRENGSVHWIIYIYFCELSYIKLLVLDKFLCSSSPLANSTWKIPPGDLPPNIFSKEKIYLAFKMCIPNI